MFLVKSLVKLVTTVGLNSAFLGYSLLVNFALYMFAFTLIDDWGGKFILGWLAPTIDMLNLPRHIFVPVVVGFVFFTVAYFYGRLSVTLLSRVGGRHQMRVGFMLAAIGTFVWSAAFIHELSYINMFETGSEVAWLNLVSIAGIIHGTCIMGMGPKRVQVKPVKLIAQRVQAIA